MLEFRSVQNNLIAPKGLESKHVRTRTRTRVHAHAHAHAHYGISYLAEDYTCMIV